MEIIELASNRVESHVSKAQSLTSGQSSESSPYQSMYHQESNVPFASRHIELPECALHANIPAKPLVDLVEIEVKIGVNVDVALAPCNCVQSHLLSILLPAVLCAALWLSSV